MSSISNVALGALLPSCSTPSSGSSCASSGTSGVSDGSAKNQASDTTTLITQPDGSTVTTVTGPGGSIISVTTTRAASDGSVQGLGSPQSAGLLNITA